MRPHFGSAVRPLSLEVRRVANADTLDVLASEKMNDEHAKWIGDGFEMVVGVLGILEQEHRRH